MVFEIFAMADNGVIGKDNGLPWRLPADMAYFKKTTMGFPIVMGRNTWESIGSRPLPGRENVVVTRQKGKVKEDLERQGCLVFNSVEEVCEHYKDKDFFVIGGAKIYSDFLPKADRLYVTKVEAEPDGDKFFCDPELKGWKLVSSQKGTVDEKNTLPHSFNVYERNKEQPVESNKKTPKQLRVAIDDLSALPENDIPEGYELTTLDPDDAEMVHKWELLNDEAFDSFNSYTKIVGEHKGYYPFCTYIICKDGEIASTATAIYDRGNPRNYGYVHMVAADKKYSGKGLGYQVCLAVLRKHAEMGCSGTWLVTDDFRKPALVTYLKLNMMPVLAAEDHKQRWLNILNEIGREDLIDYVENLEMLPEEDMLC